MENDPNLIRSPYSPLLRHTPPSSENIPIDRVEHLKSEKKNYPLSPRLVGLSTKENSESPQKRSNSLPTKKVLFLKESVKTSLQSISPTTLESNTEEPSDHVYQSLDAAHQTIRHLERLVKETLEEKEQLERECVETLSLLSECRLLLEQKEEEEVLLKLQHEKDEALILELQEALQETLLFCEHLEELNPQKTLTSLEKKESE